MHLRLYFQLENCLASTMVASRTCLTLTCAILAALYHWNGAQEAHYECAARNYSHGSFVCVCNATYCDTVAEPVVQPPGSYLVYTTSKSEHRLAQSTGQFQELQWNESLDQNCKNLFSGPAICVDRAKTRQTITGFGGSVTDSAAINVFDYLSGGSRQRLMESYFSKKGLEYSYIRTPIGCSDFSDRIYSHDDERGDYNLSKFQLVEEDTNYKIPMIREAIEVSSQEIRIIGTPWSAPAWMKINDKVYGFGYLKGEVGGQYYQAWATYFAKYLQAYADHGIHFWAVTPQNEPSDGFIPFFPFNAMGYTADWERVFVNQNLGPTLERTGFSDVKIFIYDDSRITLIPFVSTVMSDERSHKYVSGIAVHWYLDFVVPLSSLDAIHHKYPDYPMLMTEATFLDISTPGPPVALGSWDRASKYAESIIKYMNRWVTGWLDWNLVLDTRGGPSWASFYLEAPVIVNTTHDEFYRQPMHYVMGHFSKFVPRGSQALHVSLSPRASSAGLMATAFVTPESTVVVVVLNRNRKSIRTDIYTTGSGHIKVDIPGKALQTYIWWEN